MLQVLGRKTSLNVQKVMWTIGELGLPHTRADVGGPYGKNREPEYLALNPNGLIPTLIDGDHVMWESNSIVRYLLRRYGPSELLPATPQAQAHAEQWMDWQLSVFNPRMVTVFVQLIRTPEAERDPDIIESGRKAWTEAAVILDAHLGTSAYVAGERFSMGDIPVGNVMYRYWQLVPKHPLLPNLRRWYDGIAARPAFQEHIGSIPL